MTFSSTLSSYLEQVVVQDVFSDRVPIPQAVELLRYRELFAIQKTAGCEGYVVLGVLHGTHSSCHYTFREEYPQVNIVPLSRVDCHMFAGYNHQ